jgi:dTDP-4-dehydrorhamnose reductase
LAKVLVSGASGFLGSNLALEAVKRGHQVWGTYYKQPFQLKGIEASKLDICIPSAIEALFKEAQPDFVFHLAAMSKPDDCAKDEPACRQINVQGSKLLAEACAKSGAKLIFTSTDLVFDGSVHFTREEDEARPLGVYGRSKLDAEKAVLGVEGARAAVMRTVLMYGWGRAAGRSFAETWLRQFLTSQPLRAFTDQYRCPVWAEDLCDVLLKAAEADLKGIYHTAGPERMNRYDFAKRLAVEFALNPDLVLPTSMADAVFDDPRPKECSLNIEKLQAALDYKPLGVADGLKRMHERLLSLG